MGVFPLGAVMAVDQMRKADLVQREFSDEAYGIAIVSIYAPEAYTLIEQHQHSISHISYVAAGSVRASADGVEPVTLKAGDSMKVDAYKTHMFYTLEPHTRILCVTNLLGEKSEEDLRVNTEAPKILPPEFQIKE